MGLTFRAPDARVLIVDDIPTNLKVAEGLMAPYDMQIDVCNGGALAVEMVRCADYDIIFMDHMMPEMDGIEVARRIRAMDGKRFADVPIIALTANAVSGMREMFIKNGMSDFLAKPIETSKLNSILEQWLPPGKREQHSAPETVRHAAQFTIKGLDINAGISATGGNFRHYITTLSMFCKDSAEKIIQIRSAIEDHDMRLYITYIHALKSALFSIGAHKLSELAKRLEDAGRSGDAAFIKCNTEPFLRELDELLKNARSAAAQCRDTASGGEKIEKASLVTLRHALDEMDALTVSDIIGELCKKQLGSEINDMVEALYRNILMFEYDEAQAIIDVLLSREDVFYSQSS